MLNIGDRVKFLNEAGGGVITQLIDKDTVMVLSDIDDFEIPVVISELVNVSEKNEPSSTPKATLSPIVEPSSGQRATSLPLETSLLLVVDKEEVSVYLSNAGVESLVFGFYEQRDGKTQGIHSSIIEPQSYKKLESYTLRSMEGLSHWVVQGFYFAKNIEEQKTPIFYELKFQPSKIFKEDRGIFVEALQKKAIVFPVHNSQVVEQYEQSLDDVNKPIDTVVKKVRRKKSSELGSNILEVDLHIDELLDSTRGMSSKEMLEYQLEVFRKTLADNKKNKGKKIIFIHGIGNGVLKQRLRHELQKYPRYIVQDASFQQYGWGATMVIIK